MTLSRLISYRRVGGLHFWQLGSVGGSFYVRQSGRHFNTRAILVDASVVFSGTLGALLSVLS